MGFLKGCAKAVGSVALGAAGLTSAVLRACASGAGMDGVAEAIGTIEDKSFETIQNMWTPEEERTEEYYQEQEERSMRRRENAERSGAQQRAKIEKMMEERERKD